MKKIIFLLLLFPSVFVFSSESTNRNLMSVPPKERIKEFIDVMLKITNSFEKYKTYITTNGLITEDTFEVLKKNIITNSNFISVINSSYYKNTTNFFSDFKEFSQTYSYLVFSQLFQNKNEEEYLKKLDKMEKEYAAKMKSTNSTQLEMQMYTNTFKSIALMRKRTVQYRELKKKVDESVLKTVKEKEPDLQKVYKKITD